MIEHLFESVEIESIGDVVVVHFAEKLVVFQTDEPVYPTLALVWAIRWTLWHLSLFIY